MPIVLKAILLIVAVYYILGFLQRRLMRMAAGRVKSFETMIPEQQRDVIRTIFCAVAISFVRALLITTGWIALIYLSVDLFLKAA